MRENDWYWHAYVSLSSFFYVKMLIILMDNMISRLLIIYIEHWHTTIDTTIIALIEVGDNVEAADW